VEHGTLIRMGQDGGRISGSETTAGRRVHWGWFLAGLLLLIAALLTANVGSCSQGGGVPVCQPSVPRPASLALALAALYPLWRAFLRR